MKPVHYWMFGGALLGIFGIISPYDPLAGITISHFDKVAHLVASGLVVIVLSMVMSVRKSVLIAFGIFTLAELSQYFVPSRQFGVFDIVANTTGIMLAWGILKLSKVKTFLEWHNEQDRSTRKV